MTGARGKAAIAAPALGAALTSLMVMMAGPSWAACPATPQGYQGYDKSAFQPGDGKVQSAEGPQLTASAGKFAAWWAASQVKDAWICAGFWFPEVNGSAPVGGGITFWKFDEQNFFVALINSVGTLGVYRHAADGWTTVTASYDRYYINGSPDPVVHTGNATHTPATYNQLEVVAVGVELQVFVNGRRVVFMGPGLKYGYPWSFGLYGEAEPNRDTTWQFDSVTASELPGAFHF